MKCKPVIPRALAHGDVDDAVEYYINEGATTAAIGFVDALKVAYSHISHHPATGSPRYAHELNLRDLRFWPISTFPYLIFYVEREDHIDVWRILHSKRDIPQWLSGDSD